jgi:hypothetical protein
VKSIAVEHYKDHGLRGFFLALFLSRMEKHCIALEKLSDMRLPLKVKAKAKLKLIHLG